MNNDDKGQVIIYRSKDGQTSVEVLLENETVWLTQQQMAELFHLNAGRILRPLRSERNARPLLSI